MLSSELNPDARIKFDDFIRTQLCSGDEHGGRNG